MSWKNLKAFCDTLSIARQMNIDPTQPQPNIFQSAVSGLEASGVALTDYDRALFACVEADDLDVRALRLIAYRMEHLTGGVENDLAWSLFRYPPLPAKHPQAELYAEMLKTRTLIERWENGEIDDVQLLQEIRTMHVSTPTG
jgi:hypothetical protein